MWDVRLAPVDDAGACRLLTPQSRTMFAVRYFFSILQDKPIIARGQRSSLAHVELRAKSNEAWWILSIQHWASVDSSPR